MANSKLLKEAIADAKAVRETAIANAKIALEEAFTPRLQSILSRKLQAEIEGEEEEIELEEEYGAEDVSGADSSDIGAGEGNTESGTDNAQPTGGQYQDATTAHTELDPETTAQTAPVGEEDDDMPLAEGDEDYVEEEIPGVGFDDPTNADDATIAEEDEDELDLESIIRELEADMESDDEMYEEEGEEVYEEEFEEDEFEGDMEEFEEDMEMSDDEFEEDEEIDLEEILREMGYGDDEEEVVEEEEVEDYSAELEEAYKTIKTLKATINEVNLLNAKLLYANRLFRSYNLNNEQKTKVVENLDRTTSVREVKLVYATLAESMNFTGTERKVKRNIVESVSSKPTKSTAPKKEIISESTDNLANRFKQLAGIIK